MGADRYAISNQPSILKHAIVTTWITIQILQHLQAIDLEYRAKLTELAFASSSMPRLLNKFTGNGAANPDSPHAFANYRVSRDLYQAIFGSPLPETGKPWHRVGADKVNPAARALLAEHTRKLVSLTELPDS